MQKYLLLLIALLLSLSLHAADEKEISTYEKELSGLSGRDLIIKIKDITTKTRLSKPDVAIHFFNKGIEQLEESPDDKLKSMLYSNVAWAYIIKGEMDKAIELSNIALKAAKTINDHKRMSSAETAIGSAYYYKGDTTTALIHYKRSLNHSEQANDLQNVAKSLHNIAAIHLALTEHQEALKYFLKSREINLKLNKPSAIASSEMNLGELYQTLGNIEKSEAYFISAYNFFKTSDNKWSFAKINSLLGLFYSRQNQYNKAIPYTNAAIQLFTEIGDKVQLADTYRAKGFILSNLEETNQSIDVFEKALSLAYEAKSDIVIRTVTLNLSKAYLKLEKYDRALELAQQATQKAQSTGNKPDERAAEKLLSKIYSLLGDHWTAFEHLQRADTLAEEISKHSIKETNERMERRFQTAQKEKKIELLTKDNQLKAALVDRKTYERNAWIAGLALLVFIAFFFVYRQTQKRRLENERAEMMAELVERKNQLLADVSHELRTPLTVLQLKVEALQHNLVKDVNASYDSLMTKIGDINKLISDIYALAQSDIGALELNRATNDCEQYLQEWADELCDAVEAKGFQWQQNIELPTNTNVSFDENKIKQVISNLVDNSMAYTDLPGTIALSSSINEQSWQIVIEDSAPGVKDEDLPRIFERLFRVESSRSRATGGSGLGLSICKSIIDAHEGTITSSTSQLGGLAITISLPLKS
ncbi:tetratricopeptide repeat protein [Pleionea sp. CnH1-48]|uniref:tetratricopeptide repeat protein n=1 Tax=Pleionea sp. CnH1-48 TaxID=2954494 RepID=UPI002097DFB2|nr:tetratricopeptide repeat protein [Pleionea sp. CnH1-48]MCO7224245.1 tetratricopeptide repeat protein [Pleionea sp. CnH1-48]